MSRPIKRHLRVGPAPEQDENELVVRMHRDDVPKGVKWNNYIHLAAKNATITCKVRTNEMAEIPHPRIHQVNMNKNLRALLGIRSGAVYDFYVRKAPYWKAPSYILKYHPSSSARRITVLEMLGAVSVIVAIVGVLVYFLIWY